MSPVTPTMQPPPLQPFATWNPTRGVWETPQLDLYAQPAPYWAIWPTSGWMRNGSAYLLPSPVLRIPGSASSSWPAATALFRTPLATDSTRGGESLDQVKARRGTIALSHQIVDLVLNGPPGLRSKSAESETLWNLVEGIFNAGEATLTPSHGGNTSPAGPHPHPRS
ncbi:MAG: hypothetical protein VB093_05145 [Propionicimonas sp.]|nr:hypothetical protein [Propionicimonas sp.]